MRRAEFWIVWSFWTRDGDVLGNQMGDAYMKTEKGPDMGHIGDKYGFLLLNSVGTSNGLKDVYTGWIPGD